MAREKVLVRRTADLMRAARARVHFTEREQLRPPRICSALVRRRRATTLRLRRSRHGIHSEPSVLCQRFLALRMRLLHTRTFQVGMRKLLTREKALVGRTEVLLPRPLESVLSFASKPPVSGVTAPWQRQR